LQEIFTLEKIWKAYNDCKKRKKNTINALKFEYDRERNLIALLQELKSRKYKISRHICFVVTEPSVREIFAADFRDRIVHHILYNEVKGLFEADFIENSFANRVDKGTHKGVDVLKKYLKEVPPDTYYLKLDIKSFFCSINKDILYRIIVEKIKSAPKSFGWKKDILWMVEKIIYHDPARNYLFKGSLRLKALIPKDKSLFYSNGKGLPIGNLTSQFFANAYLDQLDKFVYSLGHRYYVRYVDDFIILGDKNIYGEIDKIRTFLKDKLDLKLSEKKIKFQQVSKGIDFLGYFIKPDYVLVRRKVIGRLKDKMYRMKNPTLKDLLATANSYFGHFVHANSYRLRKAVFEKYFTHQFIATKQYNSIKVNKNCNTK
jgi:hypothetical protein